MPNYGTLLMTHPVCLFSPHFSWTAWTVNMKAACMSILSAIFLDCLDREYEGSESQYLFTILAFHDIPEYSNLPSDIS